MTESGLDFAILAPVPLAHLRSGAGVAEREGFVAFGSMKWEVFEKADRLRRGQPVPVLIYPSHENDPGRLTFNVAWIGCYVGHVRSIGGAHPEGMRYRPPSTGANPSDNIGHWAIFWHVKNLRELPEANRCTISSLESYGTGYWRKSHPPRGPEIVARPAWASGRLLGRAEDPA